MQFTHLDLSCAWDGDDVRALREQPRERDLPGRRVVLRGDGVQPVDDLQRIREVLAREPGCARTSNIKHQRPALVILVISGKENENAVPGHATPEIALFKIVRRFLQCAQTSVVRHRERCC